MKSLLDFEADWLPIRYMFHAVMNHELSAWYDKEKVLSFGHLLESADEHAWGELRLDGLINVLFTDGHSIHNDDGISPVLQFPVWNCQDNTFDFLSHYEFMPFARDDIIRMCEQFSASLIREFGRLLEQRSFEIAGRQDDRTSEPTTIPPDYWSDMDIIDWGSGRASLRERSNYSSMFFALHFRPAKVDRPDLRRTTPVSDRDRQHRTTARAKVSIVLSQLAFEEYGHLSPKALARYIEPHFTARFPGMVVPSADTVERARTDLIHERAPITAITATSAAAPTANDANDA